MAIKYIEKAGHWTLNESVDVKTRVMIAFDRAAFYNYHFDDPVLPRILEILMRKYSGIYSAPVSIDEDEICARLGLSEAELHQKLYSLSLLHLIRYIPSSVSDVLFLNHERLMPKNIDLKPKTYEFLKKCQHDRIEAMIDYVTEETECRSRHLLRYFGQTDSSDCGTCDICRAKKTAGEPLETASPSYSDLLNRLSTYINKDLHGIYDLNVLKRLVNNPAQDPIPQQILDILRNLVDSGTVPPPQV